jgi:hypothetical protein
MNSNKSALEAWLAGLNPELADSGQVSWDPGFDGERRVVLSRLGPYRRLFQRPQKFIPRFFHRVYSLPIEDWYLSAKTELYSGFCSIETELNIHFQPTFAYAERNMEALPEINKSIKISYEGLIRDVIDGELCNLKDGNWIKTGLAHAERRIESVINEALMLRQIQCRTICALKSSFEEISDDAALNDNFNLEAIYLSVMQKNFEFREKQNQELLRQEEELELQRLAHKKKLLQQIDQEDEIQRQQQALKAENMKRLLDEQGQQYSEQYVIKTRLHSEKIKHEKQLQEIEESEEIEYKKNQQIRQHQLERLVQMKKREHEIFLKEQQVAAEIKEMELHSEVAKKKRETARQELDLLTLEKQRVELAHAIKKVSKEIDRL